MKQLKLVKQGNFPKQQKLNLAYKKPPNGIKTKRQPRNTSCMQKVISELLKK